MTIKKNSYLLRVDNCSRTIHFITFPFTCTINFKVLGNLLGKSAFLNIKTSSIILRITLGSNGANDVDIYNSPLAHLTIDIISNQLINILTDY